ncbi:MAG: alanine racemase [Clostridia bacterium]|nr:alanine racemase [Clostridia bacterium]
MYTLDKTTRTWVEIDLSALKHNLNYAKRNIGRKVICVIKADAYGHGAVECGKFLEANGADMFAVAALQEAIELRENGIKLPILILGYTAPEHAAIISKLDLEQTVVDEEHAYNLNQAAKEAGVTVKVHASLDTGMSRIGIFAQADHISAILAVEHICNMSNLSVVGMYTHFAAADDPAEYEFTAFQYKNYSIVYSGLAERGIRIPNCHVSNSAAILSSPIHFDSIREGIILYGLYPNSKPVEYGVLEPVMTLKTRVTQVRPLPSGVTVGYGRTYRTESPIISAVIGAGYADGYSRRLSNNARVAINGNFYPQIGRICMDASMVNVTCGDVKQGDVATLFGKGGMSLEEVSQIVGTINYELACLVTKRTGRVYVNGDE